MATLYILALALCASTYGPLAEDLFMDVTIRYQNTNFRTTILLPMSFI